MSAAQSAFLAQALDSLQHLSPTQVLHAADPTSTEGVQVPGIPPDVPPSSGSVTQSVRAFAWASHPDAFAHPFASHVQVARAAQANMASHLTLHAAGTLASPARQSGSHVPGLSFTHLAASAFAQTPAQSAEAG